MASLKLVVKDCILLMFIFNYALSCFIGRDRNKEAHNLVGLPMRHGSRTWLGDPGLWNPHPLVFPVI